jgi:hypothetical protein
MPSAALLARGPRNSAALFSGGNWVGVKEDTGFSNIIKYLRPLAGALRAKPLERRLHGDAIEPEVMFIFPTCSRNFPLANPNFADIIWCFASRTRLASSRIDVSVSAVEYCAFVFRGSTALRRGQPRNGMPGSRFCWRSLGSARGDAGKDSCVRSRGCSAKSVYLPTLA